MAEFIAASSSRAAVLWREKNIQQDSHLALKSCFAQKSNFTTDNTDNTDKKRSICQ